MAEIRAFRAFRYDLGRVGDLSEVVAPPYDVIDASLQDALYARSPYNVVRLILNKEEPSDTETHNRYSRAAAFLRDWLRDGILTQDSARALYVYHQEFEVEGQRHTRKGFLARVRLERFGEGRIYPHEETLSGPKADRLKLFRATGMNLSPIFGLYPDDANRVQTLLDQAVGRALPLQATDHLGVVSRLWPVTDQHVISTVAGLMASRPIFIADGHHRYETALRYLDERREAGEVRDAEAAANFVLMMLVSMSDPGLVILPTHRLVSGLPGLSAEQLASCLRPAFHLETVGRGEQAAREVGELIQADGTQQVLGFGTVADGVWQLARFQAPERMAELAPDHSPTWRDLAVAVLHVLVFGHLLRADSASYRYVHLLSEVIDAVAQAACDLAVLVPPARMHHVEQIAGQLEKMPPKSTYFYPKLLSGLVFNTLKGN
ncbi:MAG: DUF1015 domain-containing protein [Gemmataceae bacterium]|nr:DUF1015 domain-containing protein [Gemmataceae bacterium]MDW8267277.1 DUF1015 domain-containing protein [Gemmataceae bacterium]